MIERLSVGLAEDRQHAEDAPTDRHRHEYQRAHPEFVEDGNRRAGLARCLQGGLVVEDDERPRSVQHRTGHRHVLQTTFGIGGERRDRLADIRLAVADERLCRIVVGGGDEHERPLGEPFDDDLEHPFDRRGRIHRGDQRAADVGHHLDAAERLLGSVARRVRLRNGDARLDLRRGGEREVGDDLSFVGGPGARRGSERTQRPEDPIVGVDERCAEVAAHAEHGEGFVLDPPVVRGSCRRSAARRGTAPPCDTATATAVSGARDRSGRAGRTARGRIDGGRRRGPRGRRRPPTRRAARLASRSIVGSATLPRPVRAIDCSRRFSSSSPSRPAASLIGPGHSSAWSGT